MAFVLDASIAACWAFKDEDHPDAAAAFLLHLSRLRVRVDRLPNENALLRLARAHRLSVYDAAYLELAQREGLPLATLDADLRRAAAGEEAPLVSRAGAAATGDPPPAP